MVGTPLLTQHCVHLGVLPSFIVAPSSTPDDEITALAPFQKEI